MRPASRASEVGLIAVKIDVKERKQPVAENIIQEIIADPEKFLSNKPRSCIDNFIMALLSYYVTPSSDLQRLIFSYIETAKLEVGDKVAYFDRDLVKDIEARVYAVNLERSLVTIESAEGRLDVWLSDITYHWGNYVHPEYWKGAFRTDRDFVDDAIRICSYLPLLDRYRTVECLDLSGHIANIDVSLPGFIRRIDPDQKTISVEVNWSRADFKSNINFLKQAAPDLVTTQQRSWRVIRPREGDTLVRRYSVLSAEQRKELQAQCAEAAPITYCCVRRVWPTAIHLTCLLLTAQVLLNIAYASYAFNGYSPIQSHCYHLSKDNCVSGGGVDFYGSVCYYDGPDACYPASAPLIISLGFAMLLVTTSLMPPAYVLRQSMREELEIGDFVLLSWSVLMFVFVACTSGAALSNARVSAVQFATYVPKAFSFAVCILNCFSTLVAFVFMILGDRGERS